MDSGLRRNEGTAVRGLAAQCDSDSRLRGNDGWGAWDDGWGAWDDGWGAWDDGWGAWDDEWGARE